MSKSSLPDSVALPSVMGTRQSLICTRQRLCRVLHSAKTTRQKMSRQRRLCRVSFVGHSAKPLPSARHSVKLEPKKPEKMGFFLIGGGPHPSPVFFWPISDIFRVKFAATRPAGFEPATSLSHVPSSNHCTTLPIMSRFRFGSPHIILNRV